MRIDDGGPAFPYSALVPDNDTRQMIGTIYADNYGMTLRDFFAAKALPSVLDDRPHNANLEVEAATACAAKICYLIADAMLAERRKAGAE